MKLYIQHSNDFIVLHFPYSLSRGTVAWIMFGSGKYGNLLCFFKLFHFSEWLCSAEIKSYLDFSFKRSVSFQAVVAHPFSHSTRDAEAGRSLRLRTAWSTLSSAQRTPVLEKKKRRGRRGPRREEYPIEKLQSVKKL